MTNVAVMDYNKNHSEVNLLVEPEEYYLLNNRFDRIIGVLGGSSLVGQTVNSDIDLIALIRKGLPKSVLFSLCEVLQISMERMSELLHISPRTLQRKSNTDPLTISNSQQLLEIAEVVSEGIKVFNTLESFRTWLHSTPYVFNGQKPLDFLDTGFGTQYIKNIMGRIAHGIPS